MTTRYSDSDTVQAIYERLLREVKKQTNHERERTMTSSGLPHYRLPDSMASSPMACCYIGEPCQVHRLFFEQRNVSKAKEAK